MNIKIDWQKAVLTKKVNLYVADLDCLAKENNLIPFIL